MHGDQSGELVCRYWGLNEGLKRHLGKLHFTSSHQKRYFVEGGKVLSRSAQNHKPSSIW